MYDKDLFEAMIGDWLTDNAPEYDDLVVDDPEMEDGRWIASAHDDKAAYLLTDDGTGNIAINYDGAR